MSPVKSQGRTNTTKQRKGSQQKNVKQNASPPPSKETNGRHKRRVGSPPLQDRKTEEVKSSVRSKVDESKTRGAEPKGSQKQPQHDEGGKMGKSKTTKLKPPPKGAPTTRGRIDNKPPAEPENKSGDKVTDTEEEESESDAGSSANVTVEETSDDEKEEERGSNEEPSETHGSEESSEEEAAEDEESDKELSEEARREAVTSSEEEEVTEKEVEVSESVNSDVSEDEVTTQEDSLEKVTADKACRRRRRTPRASEPTQGTKYKMSKKTKTDKQAEKAEKKKAKAEKQRLEKEAKQKAKEEKKNRKKRLKEDKRSSATEEIRSPKDRSIGKVETVKGKTQTKQEKDDPVEADPDVEEEEAEPTVTKAIKGQNRMMLLKAKGKNLKAIPEPEEQQDAGRVVKGRPQSSLSGKVKMASLRQKANKASVKPDEEAAESEAVDVGSGNPEERLIAEKKDATLHRVSGWIQNNVPPGFNVRKKVSAWTKAMGVSHWLSSRTMKQKQGPRKKASILKHRMALRVASQTSLMSKRSRALSADTMGKESVQGKTGEGGEEAAPAGEKEVEAKYAVVLPRMNKLGKPKVAEVPQAAPGPFTPPTTTGPPGEPTTSKPKPPKPGARLVFPVKPDLSLLKSIKKSFPGGLTSGADVAERSPGSSATLEGSSSIEDRKKRAALDNQDGASVLQAARGKLNYTQINLTKMSLSGGTVNGGVTRAQEPDPEIEAATGIPRSTTQPFPNGEASAVTSGVRSLYEEEADREVAQLMGEGGIYTIPQPEVHWAGNTRMSGDPQVCVTFLVVASS